MSHFRARSDAGEPVITTSDYHPGQPFAVVASGASRDIATIGPAQCRRVTAARHTAATALESAWEDAREPARQARKAARR